MKNRISAIVVLMVILFSACTESTTTYQSSSNNQDITSGEIIKTSSSKETSKQEVKATTGITISTLKKTEITETSKTGKVSKLLNKIDVHFIDVGQADCIFINADNIDGDDIDILIDGGNNADGELVVDYLRSLSTDDIELMIATHPHEDHIGGLDNVIENFKVDMIIKPGLSDLSDTKTNRDFENAILNNTIPCEWPEQGEVIRFGDLEIMILSDKTKQYEDTNNFSIVCKVMYGDKSFVFTGDAESEVEHDIVKSNINLSADVVKIGHHGSGSSSTANFLYKIKPEYGVICVGEDNKYGHPDNLIINRCKTQGIRVLRTDIDGTIIFSTDGIDLWFDTSGDGNTQASSAVTTTTASTTKATTTVQITTTEATTAKSSSGIIISDLDKKAEYIVIKNTGDKDKDLTGWRIVSVLGGQDFVFPDNYILKSGESVKIGGFGAKEEVDIVWEEGRGIWNNSKDDDAEIYNDKNERVDFWDD
jgi:competence protein ComEC